MHTLTIVGLSTPATISSAALQACKDAAALFVQTKQTPCTLPLTQEGLAFFTMDDLYETAADFDALQQAIQERLFLACSKSDVLYALPGSGLLESTRALRAAAQAQGIPTSLLPGTGYAQAAAAAAGCLYDAYILAAASALPTQLDTRTCLLIEELDTKLRAGDIKLQLQACYPDTHDVLLATMNKEGRYEIDVCPLYALDRQPHFCATSVLLVPPLDMYALSRYGYRELIDVMYSLRAPGGCPWDAEQTHQSLKKTMVEECYEVLDAIDKNDDDALCEELGDVLLQVVFHAQIAASQGRFDERDVTSAIVKKLIYRHPHVFGSAKADTPDEVAQSWEELKKREKRHATQSEVLQAVPRNFPALMRAQKLSKKAAQVGFDWADAKAALPKLHEELHELEQAIGGKGDMAEEIGDLLFSITHIARLLGLESEALLQKASDKFITRFTSMEELAFARGRLLEQMPLEEQNELWNLVKSTEKGRK